MAKPTLSKKSCGRTEQRFEQTNSFDRHLPHSAREAAPPENSTRAPIHGIDENGEDPSHQTEILVPDTGPPTVRR